MKGILSVARRILIACLFFAAFTATMPLAHAQPSTPASPSPTPEQKTTTPGDQNTAARTQAAAANAATPQASTPRERRAQAYAKLLEGQRYMTSLRGGLSASQARLAQQSFQQAAALDPTLAEAHTALAELAFFFSSARLPFIRARSFNRHASRSEQRWRTSPSVTHLLDQERLARKQSE